MDELGTDGAAKKEGRDGFSGFRMFQYGSTCVARLAHHSKSEFYGG